ncbi:MAG: cupin domain-containing protein, partial [Nitrospiraceae bacterium]
MRAFDVRSGAPYHTHVWEREVHIISGTGRVRTERKETPFKAGDSVYIAPNEQQVSSRTRPL